MLFRAKQLFLSRYSVFNIFRRRNRHTRIPARKPFAMSVLRATGITDTQYDVLAEKDPWFVDQYSSFNIFQFNYVRTKHELSRYFHGLHIFLMHTTKFRPKITAASRNIHCSIFLKQITPS